MDEKRLRNELAALKKQETSLRKSTGFTNDDATAENNAASNSRAMRYTWLGAEFAAIFFAFIWGGQYLDKALGTRPWLVLFGICFGFGIALYRLIFVARKLAE